jgi:Domain of unknown function (DUF4389)
MAAAQEYPVRVDASLDAPLSRWLWLVKWLLLIPHYVVLAFLWLGFVAVSAVALVAIVITGRYPRSLFEFNVGVLRWTWRVQYYAAAAFGTDRYPPFTLADDPAYPARLEIAYPQRLSRGLALIKWWLLAIPHYIIVGVFTGGGVWVIGHLGRSGTSWPGLISILALIAAVVLLFTGQYPRQLFDLVVGLNRWVLRVAAYAALMTDQYPPFRLDQGGHEPGALTMPPSSGPGIQAGPAGDPAPPLRSGWTSGRVACVVAGALLAVVSLGLLGLGGAATWATTAGRQAGYVNLGSETFHSSGYAVASSPVELDAHTPGWDAVRTLFGTVRLTATPASRERLFLGIAPADQAATYLSGTSYVTVRDITSSRHVEYTAHSGTAAPAPPGRTGIWTALATGPGRQTLTWQPRTGNWTLVAMNADGSRPVSLRVAVAATVPGLPWIAGALLTAGVVGLLLGVTLIVVPARRAAARATAAEEGLPAPEPGSHE